MTDNNHFCDEAKADEWGPEIKVEGKRPEWLGDDDICALVLNGSLLDGGGKLTAANWVWPGTHEFIRLPANHPHYKTTDADTPQNAPETHRQGTNGVRTGVEMVERMEALLRRLAKTRYYSAGDQDEVAAIVRDLPEPVDPDLVEAREVCAHVAMAVAKDDGPEVWAREYRAGIYDNDDEVQHALAAIKRGRALERGDAAARSHGGM